MNLIYSESEESFSTKPTKPQIAKLSFLGTEKNLEDLLAHIRAGKSFTAAHFKNNHRSSENFLRQQMFAVDIDKNLTLSEAESILAEYNLSYTFGYYTFRHTPEAPRFRLVFVCDGIVESPDLVRILNQAFQKLFDYKIDANCSDVARLWCGTSKGIFVNDVNYTFSPNTLIDVVNYKIFQKDRNKDRYCFKNINISCNSIYSSNVGNVINIYNNVSGISTIHYPHSLKADGKSGENIQPERLYEKWNVSELMQFEIFNKFYNGEGSGNEKKLSHFELRGIASNLAKLSGGEELFKQCLRKNPHYINKESLIHYAKKNNYPAFHVNTFSPFESDKNNCFQTFYQALKKHGRVKLLSPPNLISLEEGQEKLTSYLDKVFNAKDFKVYLPKLPAGLGKTEYVKKLKGVVLCFPDHKLKEEQYNSSPLIAGVEKFCIPELKGLFSKEIENYFEALYSMDLSENVFINVRKLAAGECLNINGSKNAPEPTDVEAATLYLNRIITIKEAGSEVTIFTTHSRGILSLFEQDTIVFDEDPFSSIIVQHVAYTEELRNLAIELIIQDYDGQVLLNLLKEGDFDHPKSIPSFSYDRELIYKICARKGFKSHVYNFFNGEAYMVNNGHIHYTVNNASKIRTDKKYVILDATAVLPIYKKLIGDRLVSFDIGEIRNKGKILQHMKYSFTKDRIEKYEQDNLSQIDDSLPTITHKSCKSKFKNSSPTHHFGHCRGTNKYFGLDLNIVGTPHYHINYYKFISFAIKLNCTDFEMKYQNVNYNGREFRFITFENQLLQHIQLSSVEGELIQAVHRARLIRTDATVNVYANFPLSQAQFIYS